MARIDSTWYQQPRLAGFGAVARSDCRGFIPPGAWQHLYAAPLMATTPPGSREASRFGRDGFRGLAAVTGECTWEEAHRVSHARGMRGLPSLLTNDAVKYGLCLGAAGLAAYLLWRK